MESEVTTKQFLESQEKILRESLKSNLDLQKGMGIEQISIPPLTEEKLNKLREELSIEYQNIIYQIGEWCDIPEDYKKIIAIWIIGTYFHKKFNTYPYLFINAMRGSGKTRLLRIISYLQKNGTGEVLTNPSDSVMFRTAKERGIILDEFESEKSKDKQTMREYLNACYKKGGVVYRMEKTKVNGKEEYVAVPHQLFTPIAMANINGIEDVLGDRSISLILEKSMNPYLVKKIEDFDTNNSFKQIKANLERVSVGLCDVEYSKKGIEGWNNFIKDKYTVLHTTHTIHNYTPPYISINTTNINIIDDEIYNKIDETGIFGRNLELFFPLLLLGKTMSSFVFEEILKIVIDLNKTKKEDEFAESKDVSLIEFISLAERYRFEYIFSHILFDEYKEFIGSKGAKEDEWINPTWFGLALKRLRLIGNKRRVAKGILLLLNVDNAKEKIKIFRSSDEVKKDV